MYHVFMLSWDEISGRKLLSVSKTKEHAEDLVDEYSEMFPHAYVDYERVAVN
jgi:hypothetical protein